MASDRTLNARSVNRPISSHLSRRSPFPENLSPLREPINRGIDFSYAGVTVTPIQPGTRNTKLATLDPGPTQFNFRAEPDSAVCVVVPVSGILFRPSKTNPLPFSVTMPLRIKPFANINFTAPAESRV